VYAVPLIPIESRFQLRFAFVTEPAELASLRVYTYVPSTRGPVLLHEAKYKPPYVASPLFGFTGLQSVYEREGGELQYYCEWGAK
jgi:hypothetical protein